MGDGLYCKGKEGGREGGDGSINKTKEKRKRIIVTMLLFSHR
jgi:hypothetical protein